MVTEHPEMARAGTAERGPHANRTLGTNEPTSTPRAPGSVMWEGYCSVPAFPALFPRSPREAKKAEGRSLALGGTERERSACPRAPI